jgi:hypothetical protein
MALWGGIGEATWSLQLGSTLSETYVGSLSLKENFCQILNFCQIFVKEIIPNEYLFQS